MNSLMGKSVYSVYPRRSPSLLRFSAVDVGLFEGETEGRRESRRRHWEQIFPSKFSKSRRQMEYFYGAAWKRTLINICAPSGPSESAIGLRFVWLAAARRRMKRREPNNWSRCAINPVNVFILSLLPLSGGKKQKCSNRADVIEKKSPPKRIERRQMLIWPRHKLHPKAFVKEIQKLCTCHSGSGGKATTHERWLHPRTEKSSRGHLMWLVCVLFGSAKLPMKRAVNLS